MDEFKIVIIILLLVIFILYQEKLNIHHLAIWQRRTYKLEDNLNMNKTCAKYTRFSIWIIPHWRRNQTSLLDPAPRGTAIFRCHAVTYLSIDKSESRRRYFTDGKLIIGAAKLIDLDNNIEVFRGYFTKYIHAPTLFLFNTNILVWKQKMYV